MNPNNMIFPEIKKNNYKMIEFYNSSHETIFMNPLSDEQVKHSGRIVLNDGEIERTSLIRLEYDGIDYFNFLTRPFYILGKKINISGYFSLNQFQSNIIDIPFCCDIKDIDLKIQLRRREHCTITIFPSNGLALATELPKKQFYLLINNTSSKSHDINLVDLAQGKNIPDGLFIENSDFKIDNGGDFKLMRVWGNAFQLTEPVFANGNKIDITKYFSANQFQSNAIDIPYNFLINEDSKITVKINGNSKAMYHFV